MSKTRPGWKQKSSKEIYKNRYFQLRVDECEMADGKIMPHYFVIDFPDWVQVVAVTKDNRFIVVDQYRYPGQGWFLEFPGGSTHPSRDENPQLAAQRELAEETGFTSDKWTYLGHHYPNPALLNNRCHVYLAEDCEKTRDQNLDAYEILEVKFMNSNEFQSEIIKSDRRHSLMLATYQLYLDHTKS